MRELSPGRVSLDHCNPLGLRASPPSQSCRRARLSPGGSQQSRGSGVGCLTAVSAPPGRRPHGGQQAQHHEPLPGAGARCGEVRVCAALQAHPGARLRQPPAGPVLPTAAAEQAGGEWPSGEAEWVGQATPGAAPSALRSPCPAGTCLRVTSGARDLEVTAAGGSARTLPPLCAGTWPSVQISSLSCVARGCEGGVLVSRQELQREWLAVVFSTVRGMALCFQGHCEQREESHWGP